MKSCDITSSALSMTFLKNMLERKFLGGLNSVYEWKQGLSFIQQQLKHEKIIKIHLKVHGSACGNHFFVIWKSSSGKVGIVHGWERKFYLRQLYHQSWSEAQEYLHAMMEPSDLELHHMDSPEHASIIKKQVAAFKKLFGESVDDVEFLSEPRDVESIFEFVDIVTGLPSDTIPSVGDVCSNSPVFVKHYEFMPKTCNLCKERIEKHVEEMQQSVEEMQKLVNKWSTNKDMSEDDVLDFTGISDSDE